MCIGFASRIDPCELTHRGDWVSPVSRSPRDRDAAEPAPRPGSPLIVTREARIQTSRQRTLRFSGWLVNGLLLAGCGWFTFRIAGDLWTLLHLQPRQPATVVASARAAREAPGWSDREVIIDRNLFDSSLLAPPKPPPPPPEEEVEETELPLGLMGTVASERAELRSAAIWNAEKRDSVVVEEQDEVAGGRAKVIQIERARVLLAENGGIRELVIDKDSEFRPPTRPAPRQKPPKKRRRHRKRRR